MTPDEIIEVIERLAWLADNGERPSRGEMADAAAAAAELRKEPPPVWEEAPTWAQWWARDANASEWWFEGEPTLDENKEWPPRGCMKLKQVMETRAAPVARKRP